MNPYVNVAVRLPVELAQWVKQQAQENRRSVNAQVAILIEQASKQHAATAADSK